MRDTRTPGGSARLVVLLLAMALAAAGCTGSSSSSPPSPSPTPLPKATITVAQFNSDISDEYPDVPVDKVAEAVRLSGADVAGIEEGGAAMQELAGDLGWSYYSVRTQVVSRLPLIDPPNGNGLYEFVEVRPGQVVAVENVHLPSLAYGPYWVRNGKSPAVVTANEKKVRLPAILPSIAAAKTLEQQHIPVFLTGDFNSPSFHDWTAATAGTRKFLRYPLRWPVTAAVEAAGFRDSFRTVHPNPVTNPGITWPVHRTLPGWNPTPRDPLDRVDFVFATAPATPTASRIIGEPGGPEQAADVSPFPSDHRLVASTFTVTPAVSPTLVSASPRLATTGDPVAVTYHAPAGGGSSAVIVPEGGSPATAVATQKTDGTDGTLTFSSSSWQPGPYEAVLLSGPKTELSRYPFWVQAPGTKPTITTSKSVYAAGEPVQVAWQNAPGERWDWVSVYKRNADPNVAYYILWVYTRESVNGSATLDGSASGTWPLPPGKYSVYLLKDDLYVKVAAANFTVKG
jgi:endonuclease/exonuclease/phosphatase family metal-dependent hydrolase